MKITISTELLQKNLSFVNHAVSSKSQLPILNNILITAKDNLLKISATDLEIGIEINVKAEVHEPGEVAVPARSFLELVNSLPVENINIEEIGGLFNVVSRKTKSTFQTIPVTEFPKLYDEKGELVATMDTPSMIKDFAMVVFSASPDTNRPALSGVLVNKEDKGMLLVATDGYRLSLKHHQVGESTKELVDERMIIPARVIKEIISAKDQGDTISVFTSKEKNQVIFQLQGAILVGRLIEAEFPNYAKIIPSDFSARTFFEREELQKAVKICSVFAKDAANIIKLTLKKDKIIVSSQTPSLGKNEVEVDAALTGEENEIAFNARYLSDILTNINEESMSFEMTGPLNPGVFKIKDDESFLHLIMPIRVQE